MLLLLQLGAAPWVVSYHGVVYRTFRSCCQVTAATSTAAALSGCLTPLVVLKSKNVEIDHAYLRGFSRSFEPSVLACVCCRTEMVLSRARGVLYCEP